MKKYLLIIAAATFIILLTFTVTIKEPLLTGEYVEIEVFKNEKLIMTVTEKERIKK